VLGSANSPYNAPHQGTTSVSDSCSADRPALRDLRLVPSPTEKPRTGKTSPTFGTFGRTQMLSAALWSST
jgi:hypothetical protein